MNAKPRKFSWYDGYTTALMRISDEEVQKDLAWQLIMYGAYGIEPDFDRYDFRYQLAAQMVFDIARHTINKSVANSRNGSKESKRNKDVEQQTLTGRVRDADQHPYISGKRKQGCGQRAATGKAPD